MDKKSLYLDTLMQYHLSPDKRYAGSGQNDIDTLYEAILSNRYDVIRSVALDEDRMGWVRDCATSYIAHHPHTTNITFLYKMAIASGFTAVRSSQEAAQGLIAIAKKYKDLNAVQALYKIADNPSLRNSNAYFTAKEFWKQEMGV